MYLKLFHNSFVLHFIKFLTENSSYVLPILSHRHIQVYCYANGNGLISFHMKTLSKRHEYERDR